MSTDISDVICPIFNAYMEAKDIIKIYEEDEEYLPEGNLIEDHYEQAKSVLADDSVIDKKIILQRLWWYGEGSGRCFVEGFIEKIAPKIMGKVEAIFMWEGGNDPEGIVIEDGVIFSGRVEMRVIKE